VAFRWYTWQQAEQLGLHGLVRNLPDGSVQIIAEGDPDQLEALVAWARQGPDHAHVSSMEVQWGEARGTYTEFSIAG
jgi:acylphosphatase